MTKGDKPLVLVANEDAWRDEYVRLVGGDDSVPDAARTRYRQAEIKSAVIAEAYDKCIYCESRISHVHPGDIDHVAPKSHRPDLIVEWENLVYGCNECNRSKLDYYDEREPLVNPFVEEPGDFRRFFGPMVIQVPGSSRGLVTIRTLALDRPKLFEQRKERLERIQTLLEQWVRMEDGSAKDAVREQVLEEAGDDREYAAAVRAFIKQQAGLNYSDER